MPKLPPKLSETGVITKKKYNIHKDKREKICRKSDSNSAQESIPKIGQQSLVPNLLLNFSFNIKLQQETKKVPHGVGISRKSMVGFEGLWAHNTMA